MSSVSLQPAPSVRDCCNTTLHTIAHGLRQLGSWLGATASKVAEAAKPFLKQLGETLRMASAIAWNHTRTFFIAHKKELALVALGAGIVGLAIGLVKAIQYCCKRDAADDVPGQPEFEDTAHTMGGGHKAADSHGSDRKEPITTVDL